VYLEVKNLDSKDYNYKINYFNNRPLKLSYSSFKSLEYCPGRYFMQNIMYWKPKDFNERNFCLGSVGHSCLEEWLANGRDEDGNLIIGYMQSIATKLFDLYLKKHNVIPLNAQDINNMREKSVVNAQAIEDVFIDFGFTEKALRNETKWKIKLKAYKNVFLTGVLDLYDEDDKVVYDLKVTSSARFMDEDQICYYTMMGTLAGWKVTKCGFIVPLRKDKVVTLSFESEDFKKLYERVKKAIGVIGSSLHTGKWLLNYDKTNCYQCPVKAFCPAAKEAEKPIDRPMEDGRIKL
jgi:hypothetical protein